MVASGGGEFIGSGSRRGGGQRACQFVCRLFVGDKKPWDTHVTQMPPKPPSTTNSLEIRVLGTASWISRTQRRKWSENLPPCARISGHSAKKNTLKTYRCVSILGTSVIFLPYRRSAGKNFTLPEAGRVKFYPAFGRDFRRPKVG